MSSNVPIMRSGAVDPESVRPLPGDNRRRLIWREMKRIPPVGFLWGLARREYFAAREIKNRLSYIPRHREIRRQPWAKLQLGAGSRGLSGWLNTDLQASAEVLKVDATRPLPFLDGSFRYVFNEHMIEHLTFNAGRKLVAEVNRVLAKGGKLRISTPDFDFYLGLFQKELSSEEQDFAKWHVGMYNPELPVSALSVMNTMFRNWGHKHLYNEESLTLLLNECGFGQIKRYKAGESDDPELRGIESHGQLVGETYNRLETLVLEATKTSRFSVIDEGGA